LQQDDTLPWGYSGPWLMAGLTPHYDQHQFVPGCGHYVPENMNPPGAEVYSGFSAARDALISQWLATGTNHRYVLYGRFWDNTLQITQCNGERPASDGYVYFLGVCDVLLDSTVVRGQGNLSC